MSEIYFIAILLMLFSGVIAILITARAKLSSRAKLAFIAFVGITFVCMPLLTLASIAFMSMGAYGPLGFIPVFVLDTLYPFLLAVSCGFLLTVAVLVRRGEFGITEDGNSSAAQRKGAVWNTLTPASSRHSILRRREWASLIDHGPALLCLVFLGVVNAINGDVGLAMSLGLCVMTLLFFYIPFKDSNRGVSLGKSIAQCRVIDRDTGKPIGASQSLVRNAILMIPGFLFVEFLVIMIRSDDRRLGDLFANTMVTKGPPQFVDGEEVPPEVVAPVAPVKHPLD